MKSRLIKHIENKNTLIFILINENGELYEVPIDFYDNLEKYKIKDLEKKKRISNLLAQLRWNRGITTEKAFAPINTKYGKLGAIIRGIRYRENLSQKEFAIKINISQSDLSKIEHGKRAIGKNIIRRIVKKFKVNKNIFL